jgi:3-dehydroquinate dehydratase
VARCVICGAGPYGYILGLQAAARLVSAPGGLTLSKGR